MKKASSMGLSDTIKFLGRVLPPDLYELYKVGSLFATASEIETQGIVLIEAAATGLPLIAVDKGAVAEVCVDGENGFLCEAGNIPEISVALEKILLDDKLRERFSKRSIEIAAEHDFERTLDKFENIYQKVIKIKNQA
jgi:glycosyltransferase involved in cell wall biosynthesis